MSSEHYQKLKHMYETAPVNARIGPTIAISEGEAVVSFELNPEEQFHAAGALHGAYYFKALDDASFFAANSLVDDVFVLTASYNIQLLRPVSRGRVTARGRVVRAGGQMIFAEAVLADDQDRELARGSGVFARSTVALSSVETYRL